MIIQWNVSYFVQSCIEILGKIIKEQKEYVKETPKSNNRTKTLNSVVVDWFEL